MKALQEDSVSVEQFAEDVFKTPELVDKFKRYKKNYEETKDISIDDTFHTDPLALRHKGTGKMTTIKLDRHFDIAIHGGEEFIEDMTRKEECIITSFFSKRKNKNRNFTANN